MNDLNMESTSQLNFEAILNQKNLLLGRLRKGDVSTPAARKMGIMSPAARIMELRRKGYVIETKKCKFATTKNAVTSVALYCLISEPAEDTSTQRDN
jgi:hypothetical protein